MAGIELSEGEPWMASRWIFQRVLSEVERQHSDDPELVNAARVGDANDMLSFKFLEAPVRTRMRAALVQAVGRLLEPGGDADERLVRSLRALQQLLSSPP